LSEIIVELLYRITCYNINYYTRLINKKELPGWQKSAKR